MTKQSWEVWSANVYHLLITKHKFTEERAEDLLYGQWTDSTYDMFKENYSYVNAIILILNEKSPWNNKKKSAVEILTEKWGKPQMISTLSCDQFLKNMAIEAMEEYASQTKPTSQISDKDLEDEIAEYINNWILYPSMTRNRIARHIIEMIRENKRKTLTTEEKQKLAEIYNIDKVCVAQVCDEVLDRTGGLLGEIRELSKKI